MQRQEADRARKAADRAAEEREERATRQHYAELQQKEAARQQQQMEAERLPGPLGGLCQPALQLAWACSICKPAQTVVGGSCQEAKQSRQVIRQSQVRQCSLDRELAQCLALTLHRLQRHSMRGP